MSERRRSPDDLITIGEITDRETWLAVRRASLGASEVPAVIGIDPFKTALDVWAAKVGIKPDGRQSPQAANGNRYEPAILAEYAEIVRCRLARPGTLRIKAAPWISATPDAVADDVRDVQVKAVGRFMSRKWDDGPPDYVIVQVQWELMVTGLAVADVVAKFSVTDPPAIFPVVRDDEMIADLVEICGDWWETHVVGGEMPEIVEGDSAMSVLAARFPRPTHGLLPMASEVEALARQYDKSRELQLQAEAEQKRIGAEICARIGEAQGFEGPTARVTWKERAAHTRPACEVKAGRVLRVDLKGDRG